VSQCYTMYPGRPASSAAGGGLYQAPLRAGALSDPATAGVYSSATYAAVAAAAHGFVPFALDSVAFYPSLQVTRDAVDRLFITRHHSNAV